MKKMRTRAKNSGSAPAKSKSPGQSRIWLAGLGIVGIASAVFIGFVSRSPSNKSDASSTYAPRPPGTLTFNKDIAPIVFQHCAPCHRPGQSAPFTLLRYEEVRKRAELIAEVTGKRYMPPWLPEPGYGQFADERRLSLDEIGRIQQWFAEGAAEGRAADLPPLPQWPEGWELGQPDLVLTLPSAYALAPDGKDIYRNFVVPNPSSRRRFVKAVDFHPGNSKVVHHVFIEIDPTRQARHATDHVSPPGFDGMRLPDSVQMPGGQLLGWQPGKRPYVSPEGLSWVLEPNSDLVLQMHMHPSGKPESVQPVLGFYFTDQPPTNTPYRINLLRYVIDVPPGARDYSIENRYVLPVDADLLRILPHAHYLGKELQGYAILPQGVRKWLLLIKNWDFNWQGDYRYAQPVFLPKGTTLVMHFNYDNSDENTHNPNHPPRRVRFGLQTTDEMGELGLQLLARNPEDRRILASDFFVKFTNDAVEANEHALQIDPQDAAAHTRLAVALIALGRTSDALDHLQAAIQLRPGNDEAHGVLGGIYLRQNRLSEARTEFENVLRLKPTDYQACGSLGFIFLRQGNLEQAELYLEHALRINPDDPIARANLDRVWTAKKAERRRH